MSESMIGDSAAAGYPANGHQAQAPAAPGGGGGAGVEPPYDLLAEQAVLGAMLMAADAVGDVADVMAPVDFYQPRHVTIAEAIVHLYGQGDPTDPLSVSAELERRGELHRVGGTPYLHTCWASVATSAAAGYHATLVREKALKRRAMQAGMRMVQAAHTVEDVMDVLDAAQAALDTVLHGQSTGAGYALVSDMRATMLSGLDDVQAGRTPPGLPTGFLDLDAVIGGFKAGQLIVIAGRPGLGKSTLALDIVRHASIVLKQTSVVFSLEMSQEELWYRMISAQAKLRLQQLQTPGALSPAELATVADTHDKIAAAGPLILDGSSDLGIAQIRAKARRIKARHGLGLVVVDYLQLMSSGKRVESRQLEVSEFSRQLKILAKELEVPVIALSQLNRGPEQRVDKRPMLSDLRESGAVEQDADMVMLLHRPDAYEHDSDRAGEADVILAKHRGGPTCTVALAHQLHYSRFANLNQSATMAP